MDNFITSLDGDMEEQIANLKEFLGLSPEQSFQDLDVDTSDMEDDESEE